MYSKTHKKRLRNTTSLVLVAAVIVALIMYALNQNINYFYSPEELLSQEIPQNKNIRVGGMVVKDSVKRNNANLEVEFTLTDYKKKVTVKYDGILPALFREGQGIVAEGSLSLDHIFIATQVLAKHDENYMPKEVKDLLAKNSKEV